MVNPNQQHSESDFVVPIIVCICLFSLLLGDHRSQSLTLISMPGIHHDLVNTMLYCKPSPILSEMGGSSYIIRFTILPPVTGFYHVYPFVCLINCLDQCVLVLFGLTTPVGLDLTVQTSLVDDLETSQHAQI